ncbi:MAG: ABC transporter permease [Odoribacteraceae bacterium]|jgi:ABC-2 type transport system permease protein|nr:ABC transporter permease [Odoribacteraceae bacterium]
MKRPPSPAARLFRAFTLKEFRHIFRDKRTLLVLLGMPVVQIVLFGFAITTEAREARVVLLSPSPGAAERRVTDRLLSSDYFELSAVASSPSAVERALRRGEADVALVFEPAFDERLARDGKARVQLVVDATNPGLAAQFSGHASAIIAAAAVELAGGAPPPLAAETRLLHNPGMKAAYNFVPGVAGFILMLVCAMMTSVSIVREKENGTMDMLLVSPARPWMIIAAKLVPYFTLSCVNLATILLLSVGVLGVPVAGSPGGVVAVSLLFILVSLSIGIFVSTVARDQVVAMLVSGMVLMMPVVLLSGLIFPVENMPPLLEWLSRLIPARWYIAAMKKIMIEGAPLHLVTGEILALAATGAALLLLGLKKFNDRVT